LELARHLQSGGIATIETHEFFRGRTRANALTYPAVVKPRDGAGSQATFLIPSRADFERWEHSLSTEPRLEHAIWQPFVSGAAVSVALIVAPDAGRMETLPVCEQRLSGDGRFSYLGGRIPARCEHGAAVQDAALRACRLVPGLRGYVGVDLIVPDASPWTPAIVEINPRLTTSYIGDRALSTENLAARLLPHGGRTAIDWHAGAVSFDAAGAVSRL
jgi:hypothetical protein